MIIKMVQALGGDCFLIDFQNGSCILIDGGFKDTYKESLRNLLINLNKENKCIEYLISTHFDNDHIGGLISLFKENGTSKDENIIHIENIISNGFYGIESSKFKNIEENDYNEHREISMHQEYEFDELCAQCGYIVNKIHNGNFVKNGDTFDGNGYKFRVLTPTIKSINDLKEHMTKYYEKKNVIKTSENEIYREISGSCDTDILDWNKYKIDDELSVINKASISIEIEFEGKYYLFCADADMNLVKDDLKDNYELIKLSHHGTYCGNQCFCDDNSIIANKYIVSTNGMHSNREHPSRYLLYKICSLKHEKEIYFNYDISNIKNRMYEILNNSEQMKKYKFITKMNYKQVEC